MWETSFPFCACKRDCVGKAAFGRWRDECYFARGGKVTKTPPGNGSKSPFPRTPCYGGGSLRPFGNPRRAKSSSVSVLLPGLRPFCHQNLKALSLYVYTAWCLPTCLVRRWLGGTLQTKTVGATKHVIPTVSFRNGRRGKAKLCRKLFCLLFSRKK